MPDEQDRAEQLDDDVVYGDDEIVHHSEDVVVTTDDQVWEGDEEEEYPPDRLSGVPFSDADVTDESFADRLAQMEPDVGERTAAPPAEPPADPAGGEP